MRASIRVPAALAGAALTLGGLAVAVAPSAAACGGYGEPACQTFVLSFNANGGVCSPSSVSATENTWATLLSGSQCTRAGFSLTSWAGGGSTFAPGAQVFVTGNNGFTANWTSTTPTSSPTPTGGTTAPPTTGPTASPTATPIVSIPPGQTNPDDAVRVGTTPASRAQAGMTIVSQATASETPVTRPPAPPSERLASAPRIEGVARGDVVRVRTQVDSGVVYQVRVKRNDGPYNFISRVTGAANGNVTLPAIQMDRRGTYTFALTDNSGNTLYIRVVVN